MNLPTHGPSLKSNLRRSILHLTLEGYFLNGKHLKKAFSSSWTLDKLLGKIFLIHPACMVAILIFLVLLAIVFSGLEGLPAECKCLDLIPIKQTQRPNCYL